MVNPRMQMPPWSNLKRAATELFLNDTFPITSLPVATSTTVTVHLKRVSMPATEVNHTEIMQTSLPGMVIQIQMIKY